MSEDMVNVTIQVPKGVSDFVQKLAALEGTTPQEWYQHWICQDFDSIRDNNFIIEDLDREKMKQLYHYERQ